MKIRLLCAMILIAGGAPASAQSVRSLVNGGNDLYQQDKYTDAEVNYRKALEQEQRLVQGHFDLGNALHKEGKYDEAVKEYEQAIQDGAQEGTKAHAYYNIGNSLMKEQKYADAVKSYIASLTINPHDEEAKYNLSYALEKMKQPPQQKQNEKNKENKNKDKQKDQQKQNQNQQQPQDQKQQQQAAKQQKQISKADAERILDVLKNSERDVQRKLRARQAVRPKTDKDW